MSTLAAARRSSPADDTRIGEAGRPEEGRYAVIDAS